MFSWEPTTACLTTASRGLALQSRPKREPDAGSYVLTRLYLSGSMCVNMLLNV
jgi:hypothetical protein